ncbi:hypothetical protein ABZ215_13455 [Amycolatopsis sp. NPDC006131]|uniref:hypothetical protein n=1 Tax=Amycolatopsis sp. NPDC006131 TaxID=3156731 RepID=UPI0033B73A8D
MKCRHGYQPGPSKGWTIRGSVERLVAKHERSCKKAQPFWHEGFIFRVICCGGCGQKIY